MFFPIRSIAASASASENGLARFDTNASRAWVKLSTPVSAVVLGGTVRVSARRAGSMLYIRVDNPVDDDTAPAASGKGSGIGLTNVRQRLAGAYKHEASIRWGLADSGFGVEIAMPAQTTGDGE